jgi:hypothetical protein
MVAGVAASQASLNRSTASGKDEFANHRGDLLVPNRFLRSHFPSNNNRVASCSFFEEVNGVGAGDRCPHQNSFSAKRIQFARLVICS